MLAIKENIPLDTLTTFRVGGPARFFAVVKSVEELVETIKFAKEKSLPIFVLGGGSNVLVADEGFKGLVIKMEIEGIEIGGADIISGSDATMVFVKAGAGVNWDDFVGDMVVAGYSGLENLSHIPGTVGAAPIQNIGAYGVEVKSIIHSVEIVEVATGQTRIFSNAECEFEYRNSFFKKNPGKYIVTAVIFKLQKSTATAQDMTIGTINTSINISYKDLAEYFSKIKNSDKSSDHTVVTPADVRKAVIEIRTAKLPEWRASASSESVGTAGSVFKNPVITAAHYVELLKKYPDMPSFPTGTGLVKIPLAWILDNVCGYRGLNRGNIGVYKNQALVIVNNGGGTASEIMSLVNEMSAAVKEATSISVEMEVQYVA